MTDTPNPTQGKGAVDDRLRTHARTIVEGEGAEIEDTALVEAVAHTLADFLWSDPDIGFTVKRGEIVRIMKGASQAALSTIRKHQAGE